MEAKEPHDAPCARSRAISAGETEYEAGGLPTCFPSAFARESPDRMRSLMRTVSTFAIVARVRGTQSIGRPAKHASRGRRAAGFFYGQIADYLGVSVGTVQY